MEAPVTATTVSSVNFSSGPRYTDSSAAACGSLPTSWFPTASEYWSSAPDGGMPRW